MSKNKRIEPECMWVTGAKVAVEFGLGCLILVLGVLAFYL